MLNKKELKTYKALLSRQGRRKSDLCICEGMKCCKELFKINPNIIEKAFFSGKRPLDDFFPGLFFEEISDVEMKQISPTVSPQGILFIVRRPEFAKFAEFGKKKFIVVLDKLQDPGNLGTIIRTVKAIGLDSIFLSEDSADPYSDKVIRAATAMQFSLKIYRYDDLERFSAQLLSKGCRKIFLSVVSGGENIFCREDLFEKSAIIFGNEGGGLSRGVSGIPVSIPMPGGIESLNVAQAVTITLFEAVRRSF